MNGHWIFKEKKYMSFDDAFNSTIDVYGTSEFILKSLKKLKVYLNFVDFISKKELY